MVVRSTTNTTSRSKTTIDGFKMLIYASFTIRKLEEDQIKSYSISLMYLIMLIIFKFLVVVIKAFTFKYPVKSISQKLTNTVKDFTLNVFSWGGIFVIILIVFYLYTRKKITPFILTLFISSIAYAPILELVNQISILSILTSIYALVCVYYLINSLVPVVRPADNREMFLLWIILYVLSFINLNTFIHNMFKNI